MTDARLEAIEARRKLYGDWVASIIEKLETLATDYSEAYFFEGASGGFEYTVIYETELIKVTVEYDKSSSWSWLDKFIDFLKENGAIWKIG